MKPIIPMGGFLAAKYKDNGLDEMAIALDAAGAKTVLFPDNGVLLASWQDFPGQGIWVDGDSAVAFDLQLTNERNLWDLLDQDAGGKKEQGRLLWSLYKKFGLSFTDKLRGAFAFTIWDGIALIVITDFYGIRPVVYCCSERKFIAASRIRHLLLDKSMSRQIDPEAIYHYFFFQAVCSPVSIYKNIRKLAPGKGLRFEENEIKVFTHYDIRYRPSSIMTESHWTEAIFTEMEKAVKAFLPGILTDKTGCFLSGGTDSSSVAGLFTRLTGNPAKTFSIGFEDPKYNELGFAQIAAERFGTHQHDYCVTPGDVMDLIDMLPGIYDEPFGNASVVPAYYCAGLAKEAGINLLFGGDGGDEIFGGNERYVTNLIFQLYFALPGIFRKKFMEPLLCGLPPKGLIRKAQSYVNRANLGNPRRFFSYNLLAETDPIVIFQKDYLKILDTDCFIKLSEKLYNNDPMVHDTDRLLYIDMKFTITDNDLRKVTQMVEAAGIQVAYPLLDRDLVDFSATIPPTLKVKWKKNRYIFKKAMKGFLPHEIIQKSKHGMGLPISPWFKKDPDLHALLYDTLFTGNPEITSYLTADFLNRMKLSFEKEATSYFGDNLWVFLILELWLKRHS